MVVEDSVYRLSAVIFRRLVAALLLAGLVGCVSSRPAGGPAVQSRWTGVSCGLHGVRYDQKRKEEAWALIREYSSEGAFMIGEVGRMSGELCGEPSEHFVSFVQEGEKDINYYTSLTVSVHEMAHSFTSMLAASTGGKPRREQGLVWIPMANPTGSMAVYLPGKGIIDIPNTPTFPAMRISDRVPEELRDLVYRIYLQDERHAAQHFGVYGLLDEFHAYYHDHQMSERMLRSDKLHYFDPGDYLNFLYFKYYIVEYLDYARENEKKIFEGILANQVFLETFLDLHDRFEALHNAHLAFRQQHVTEKAGGRYSFRGKGIVYPGVAETYAALTETLSQERFTRLMALLRSRAAAQG